MKAYLMEVWSATRESLLDFRLEGKLRVCLKEGGYPMNTSGKPYLLRHRNRKQERSSSGPEPTTGTQKTLD